MLSASTCQYSKSLLDLLLFRVCWGQRQNMKPFAPLPIGSVAIHSSLRAQLMLLLSWLAGVFVEHHEVSLLISLPLWKSNPSPVQPPSLD